MNFITDLVKEQGVTKMIFNYIENKLHNKMLEELKEIQSDREEYFDANTFDKKDIDYYTERTLIQNADKSVTYIITKERSITEDGELFFKYVIKKFGWFT